MRPTSFSFFVAMFAALTAVNLSAGSLDPPAAPNSTPGPEPRIAVNSENTPGNSVSLYRITNPGSYYLTGNIFERMLSDNRHGIVIEASDVTLDLNGFLMDGNEPFTIPFLHPPDVTPSFLGPATGVLASGSIDNVIVLNGTLRDWGSHGVDLLFVNGGRVEGITVSDCGGNGIRAGEGYVVRNCSVTDNGGDGIYTNIGCTVLDCAANSNDGDGIRTSFGCVVRGCSSIFNGADGIGVSVDSLVVDCAATSNTGNGIRIEYQAIVSGCVVSNNDASGVYGSNSDNRIDSNNITNCGTGITLQSSGNLIIRNSLIDNTTTFSIPAGNTVGPVIGAGNPITSTNPWANFAF